MQRWNSRLPFFLRPWKNIVKKNVNGVRVTFTELNDSLIVKNVLSELTASVFSWGLNPLTWNEPPEVC